MSIELLWPALASLRAVRWSGPVIDCATSPAAGPAESSQLKRMLPALRAVPTSPLGAGAVGLVHADVVPAIVDCGPNDVPSLQLTANWYAVPHVSPPTS